MCVCLLLVLTVHNTYCFSEVGSVDRKWTIRKLQLQHFVHSVFLPLKSLRKLVEGKPLYVILVYLQ